MSSSSSSNVYCIMEMYSNPYEYSSYNGKFPILRGITLDITSAADIIAKKNIDDLQKIIDRQIAGQTTTPFAPSMFIVQSPINTFIDPITFQNISINQSDLSHDVLTELEAITKTYNDIFTTPVKDNLSQVSNDYLRIDPSSYSRDRRAREIEMMKRFHTQPIKRSASIIPQPAQQIVVRNNPDNDQSASQGLKFADERKLNATEGADSIRNNPGISSSASAEDVYVEATQIST